jgi:hypothetical protein
MQCIFWNLHYIQVNLNYVQSQTLGYNLHCDSCRTKPVYSDQSTVLLNSRADSRHQSFHLYTLDGSSWRSSQLLILSVPMQPSLLHHIFCVVCESPCRNKCNFSKMRRWIMGLREKLYVGLLQVSYVTYRLFTDAVSVAAVLKHWTPRPFHTRD